MVFLYIKSTNTTSSYQEFSVGKLRFEEAIGLLNKLVSKGVILTDVYYTDGSPNRKSLPLAAFDGKSADEIMRQLELALQALLSS